MQNNMALDAAMRASERSATRVHGEMKRGLNSLASIAATAPLVSSFGTLLGIANSFLGLGTERSAVDYGLAGRLSESLIPTGIGLLTGIMAFCIYKYFVEKLEDFDAEMRNGSLQLLNELALTRF
jgi:biopolymer transport protein ExbB/TolQ